ncbi:MAG: IS21 family transposase [Polyangiales bacterium]|nr:IS21 family transposase [Sandaracinaceae bacterium]
MRRLQMAYRELKMIEVKEVLRRFEAGHGLRQIARETGLDRKTVRRYVDASTRAEGTDDARVQQMVQEVQGRPAPAPSEPRRVLDAHRERIHGWLFPEKPGQRALRLTKVHTLLARHGVDVTYATLCRWAHDELGWRERKPTVRVDDPPPGEEAQVDFGKMGTIFDHDTGKPRALWCLVVTLTCSRMQFVWPTFEQTTAAICEGLDEAWKFFGGVVARVVIDNPKTMVIEPHATAPRFNDTFLEYAQARGFFADPARVRHPKDKPRVENQVPFVRESWFDGEQFKGLEDTRRSALQWCRDVAEREHGTTRRIVREHFEQEEKPKLKPAPTTTFDVPRWTEAKVHPDHHVQISKALYSVPSKYIGRTLRVREDRQLVRLYLGGELIKTHARQRPGHRSTDPNDYPIGKDGYATRSLDNLLEQSRVKGEHVGEYMSRLIDGPLPWTRMRQGYQLLRLCDRYGRERVDAACAHALSFDVLDVPRVAKLLQRAFEMEASAEDRGALARLDQHPRFGRERDAFQTRRDGASKPKGDE